MKKFLAVATVFSLVLLVTPGLANAAVKEVFTCGAASNYHAGYYQTTDAEYFSGARGYIRVEYGAVCDTDRSQATPSNVGNFTNEYTMIANNTNSAFSGWAQSGIIRSYNTNDFAFAQQYIGGGGGLNTVIVTNTSYSSGSSLFFHEWRPYEWTYSS